jgi:hypothetical protein
MHVSRKSRQKLHAELKRIASLQSEWNALSMPERARVAVASPDLSLFFRPNIGPGVQVTGQIVDLSETKRRAYRRGPQMRAAALRIVERGDISSGSHVRINNRSDVHA